MSSIIIIIIIIIMATTEKSAFYLSDSRYNAILLHDCFVKEEEE